MKLSYVFSVTILLYCLAIVYCAEKEGVEKSANTSSSGTRQATNTALTASGILSTLTSFLPSSLTSFLPGLLLFGLGAMLVPAFGLGVMLREGRRSDYNVQPNNLAYTNNPLFAKNLQVPPIIYNHKEFEAINRGIPYAAIKTPQPQLQFQQRSMQSSNDLTNLVVDALGKWLKSLDNINTENKKNLSPNRQTVETN